MNLQTPEAALPQPDPLLLELFATIQAKSPKLAEATLLAAIPFRFDQNLLCALRAAEDGLEGRIIERLDQFSFLGKDDEGRYYITHEARRYLLHEAHKDRAWFVAAQQRALTWFDQQLAARNDLTPAQREELLQARLYHLLAVDADQGIVFLQQLIRQARDEYRPAAAEKFLSIAEEQRYLLTPPHTLYLDFLHGSVAQLQGDWESSRQQLTTLLDQSQTPLPPDLQARTQRELGRALAEQGRQVEAITLIQTALESFQQQGNRLECALTQLQVGRTALQLALEIWGGGEPFLVTTSRFRWLGDLFSFIARLPLVLYLITQLGMHSLWPVLHRIGRNMDWLVAKLFVTAAHHFRQAERTLQEIGDTAGAVQVREELGRLFLALNHPRESENIWRDLLTNFADHLGPYRQAVAQLGLGWVLLRQGKLVEARTWLEAVGPIFARFGHQRRMAQTETLLAQLAVREEQPTLALTHYRSALRLWQQVPNLQEATDILHQMEAVAALPAIPMPDKQTVDAISAFMPERRYLQRYHHPLLDIFRRLALILLVVIGLLALFSAIRTETGTRVGATAALIKPITAATDDELSPTVEVTFNEQLLPDFDVKVVIPTFIGSLSAYFLLYTMVGLFFIFRTPLQTIQATAQADLHLNQAGIQFEREQDPQPRLLWADIGAAVLVNRFQMQRFVSPYSNTTLIGSHQLLHFDGYTNHYTELQKWLLRQLPAQARVYKLGFRFPFSISGLVFCAALGVLALFVVLGQGNWSKSWLTASWPGGYSLSAFYNLSYLGVLLPLVWWFIIQPLRRLFIFEPSSPLVWGVGATGLVCTGWSLFQFFNWTRLLGRPDLTPGIIALILLLAVAIHVGRARQLNLRHWLGTEDKTPRIITPYVYQPIVRYAVTLLALGLVLLLLWQLGRELRSFHHLVLGNHYLQEGEHLRQQSLALALRDVDLATARESEATTAYEQAVAHYDQSLALQPYSVVYNSRGAVLDQLRREEEALASYRTAIELSPQEPAYRINLALAYSVQASRISTFTAKVATYQAALALYDELLTTNQRAQQKAALPILPLEDQQQIAQARLFRASTYYALARAMYIRAQTPAESARYEEALDYAEAAFADYDWLIHNSPAQDNESLAAYYSGRGWSRFMSRIQYASTDPSYKAVIQKAIDEDFTQATQRHQDNVSAYTGLGWTYWELMRGVTGCEDANKKSIDQAQYIEHRERSIAGLTEAIRLQPTSAIHYRTRAQMKYLLRDCPSHPYSDTLRSAIADYDLALIYAPTNAGWHSRRGDLYMELGNRALTAADDKAAAYQGAIDSYTQAVTLKPDINDYMNGLKNAYLRRGFTAKEAVDAALRASGRSPDRFDTYIDMARKALAANRTNWALANLQQAVVLQPENYTANWLLARAQYDAKSYTDALITLTQTRQLAPTAYDPLWLTGLSLYQLKRYTETLPVADRGLQIKPDDYELHWLKAKSYQQLGDPTAALQEAQFALATTNFYTQSQPLVTLFRQLGEPALAESAATKALQQATTVAHYKALSRSFRQSKEAGWALAAARKGNSLDLTYPDPLGQLGWNAYEESNFTLAISATVEAIEFQPTEPRLRFNLGVIQLAAGHVDAARAAYTQAIVAADDPKNADIRQARYNEALNDLRNIVTDPRNAYLDVVALLRTARDAGDALPPSD